MRNNALLMFSALTVLLLVGLVGVPQNAYAGYYEEEEIDHGEVVAIHCEGSYEWEMFFIFGERYGYAECIYVFEDEFEQEVEVEIGGEFEVLFFLEDIPITGGFHLEDDDENTLWLSEEGFITLDCGDTEPEEEETAYCLETDVTVEEGEGIFEDKEGSGIREAFGYFVIDFPDFYGEADFVLWVFFGEDEPEEEVVVEEEKNGSGCTNCEPPTLGLNKAGDRRMVDNGFGCDSQVVDVGHYYTDFPLITMKVGQPFACQFKIYEDTHADNIRHFEFAVGKRVGDAMSDVQGKIVWDRDFKLVETVTYDEDMFRDVMTFTSKVKCTDESANFDCLQLIISAIPKQPLVDDLIVKTNVWDENRNAKQNFYNDGIDFVGYTENSLPTYNVVDGRNGAITIYTTDYTLEDLTHAVDENGNTWTLINNIWNKDYVMPSLSCDISSYIGYDRTCPEFSLLKIGQADMALDYFDSSKIQSQPSEPFAYVYPEQTDRLAGTLLG